MSMVETSSGNIYADLGYPTAESMQAKAQIVAAMIQAIEAKKISINHVTRLIGAPQDELSKLLTGQFQNHSISELERMHKEILQCAKI